LPSLEIRSKNWLSALLSASAKHAQQYNVYSVRENGLHLAVPVISVGMYLLTGWPLVKFAAITNFSLYDVRK
jgi:hypothetical protein